MAQVVRCTDCGAYYNGQYYSVCPHCKKGHAESVPKPEQTDAPQKPDVKKGEPSVYVPPQRGNASLQRYAAGMERGAGAAEDTKTGACRGTGSGFR